MPEEPLALPLDLPPPSSCWYCGLRAGALEVEHQLPISRGGLDANNTVGACGPCNDLKGPLSLEEFRRGLAERIGTDVVFAGEAVPAQPATPGLARVRSLSGDRSVVRLDPVVGEELHAAWRYLRSTENPHLTRRDLASACISGGLADMREGRDLGEEWPEPTLTLFDAERHTVTASTDLAQTPRVPMPRQHTKVPGELLDWARAGVEHRRANGDPELQLLDWIGDALRAALAADVARYPGYPTMSDALDRRYGD